jgi:hypothetical protein
MPLVYIAIGWITGIALAAQVPNTAAVWPAIALAGVVLVVLMRRDFRLRQFALLIAALGLGIWRYSSAQPHFTESDLATYNDKGFAAIYGTVVDTPDVRDQDVRLRVAVDSIQPQGQPAQTVHGLAIVNADRFGAISTAIGCASGANQLRLPCSTHFLPANIYRAAVCTRESSNPR